MSLPAWTSWARDGSEHEFSLRHSQGGAVTLHVDGGSAANVTGMRWSGGRLDVTSYGDAGKSFVTTTPYAVTLDLAGGSVRLDVVGEAETSANPRSMATKETRFTGRVAQVDIVAPAGRAMRDSPPSEDVLIECQHCGDEYPPAEMRYAADPYREELFGDVVESWWCGICLQDARDSV